MREETAVKRLWFATVLTLAVVLSMGAGDDGQAPARSQWNGFDRLDFQVDGRSCLLVLPKTPAPGKPWIWRTEFFGHEPQGDLALLSVCGAADETVPIEENTRLVEQRYRQLGGEITVIAKPNCGHHPHSLKDPAPIVEFVLKHTR